MLGTERQPSSNSSVPRRATISGLTKLCGALRSSEMSMTMARLKTFTWGAARPMPGASYMVCNMSSSRVRYSSSTRATGWEGSLCEIHQCLNRTAEYTASRLMIPKLFKRAPPIEPAIAFGYTPANDLERANYDHTECCVDVAAHLCLVHGRASRHRRTHPRSSRSLCGGEGRHALGHLRAIPARSLEVAGCVEDQSADR